MHIGVDAESGDKTVVSIWSRGDMSIIEPPDWAGDVVAITEFNGILVVACKRAVFRLRDGVLYPLTFSE
jgi:hypothetical protein